MPLGIKLSDELQVKKLISAFYYELPTDFKYGGESHNGWEFVYVDKGKVSVKADKATYILKSGEMVCHKPYEYHAIRPYKDNASVIIFCFSVKSNEMDYFNNKIISANNRQKHLINDIAETGPKIFSPKDPLTIAVDGAMDRVSEQNVFYEQYMKNTIELLLLSLLESPVTKTEKRAETYTQLKARKTLTADIINYLNDNLENSVNLTEISNKFCYSLSSIKRIFKEQTGSSIIDYLNNLRLERAKEMLKSTDFSVEDISSKVGYSNIYYFSNSFKAKTGVSPLKYRKENTDL